MRGELGYCQKAFLSYCPGSGYPMGLHITVPDATEQTFFTVQDILAPVQKGLTWLSRQAICCFPAGVYVPGVVRPGAG